MASRRPRHCHAAVAGPWRDHLAGFPVRRHGLLDLVDLPPESIEVLAGIELWIVDAQFDQPRPSHFHLDLTLERIERIKPKRAIPPIWTATSTT
jgi:hypothetical protein